MNLSTRTGRRCPNCGAPEVKRRPDCWSCGHHFSLPTPAEDGPGQPAAAPVPALPPNLRLCGSCGQAVAAVEPLCPKCGQPRPVPQKRPPHLPEPSLLLRPCLHCGKDVAPYHTSCPRCGKPPGVWGALVHPSGGEPEPRGWTVTPEPDGMAVVMRAAPRRSWLRAGSACGILALGAFYAWTLVSWPHTGGHPPGAAPVFWGIDALLAAVVVALAGSLAALTWARQEWRVGPDFLEVRYALFGQEWVKTYTGAYLAVARTWHRRSLLPNDRLVLRWHDRPAWAWFGDSVGLDAGPFLMPGEAEELGRYLAERTGWTLRHEGGPFA